MLTRNDLRVVLIEALQGAADGLRGQMDATSRSAGWSDSGSLHLADQVGEWQAVDHGPVAFGGRLLLSVPEAAAALGVARSGVYSLISSGELATVKLGRRRLVPVAALQSFVAALR